MSKKQPAAKRTPSKPSAACCTLQTQLSPQLFKSLGDPNRIRLVLQLAACRHPCTVGELAECLTVDPSVVSRHLAFLRDAGVLQSNKAGKQVFYSLRYAEMVATLRSIADAIEVCCPGTTCCIPTRTKSKPLSPRSRS